MWRKVKSLFVKEPIAEKRELTEKEIAAKQKLEDLYKQFEQFSKNGGEAKPPEPDQYAKQAAKLFGHLFGRWKETEGEVVIVRADGGPMMVRAEILKKTLKAGEGKEVKLGDMIKIHYKGYLAQGDVAGRKPFEETDRKGDVPAHFRLGTITVCFIAMCIAQFATGQVCVCVRVHRWSRVRSGAWRVCVSARRPYCGFRPSSASGMRRRRASQPDRYMLRVAVRSDGAGFCCEHCWIRALGRGL
jgi:FKBP-type peptidyl-prolyl cis-trans isomerase